MTTGFAPLSRTLPYWPSQLLEVPDFLDEIGVSEFEVASGSTGTVVDGKLLWVRELAFGVPFLKGVSLVLLSNGQVTEVPFSIRFSPAFSLTLPDLSIALRFSPELLKPARPEGDHFVEDRDPSGNMKPVEIKFGGIGVTADLGGNVEVTNPAGLTFGFGPALIGNSGVVIDVQGVTPYLTHKQPPPQGAPPGFRGVALDSVTVYLPSSLNCTFAPNDIKVTNALIGTGGFSGTIASTWPANESRAATLLGMTFTLTSVSLTFVQNVPVESSIKGELTLPFFDSPIDIEAGIGLDGDFTVALSSGTGDGLYKLTKAGLFELTLQSLAFEVVDGAFAVKLSGDLKPTINGLTCDIAVNIREMTIDKHGRVKLDGGWLDLPEQIKWEVGDFAAEITQIGFGTEDDGYKWVGFSGGIQLAASIALGAKFDNLRIMWKAGESPRLKLEGVAVELMIPDVLSLEGHVKFINDAQGRGFKGGVSVSLFPVKIDMACEILCIKVTDGPNQFTAFYVYSNITLPMGIPLAATGVAIFGFAGLYGQNVYPDKTAEELWYENWYKAKRLAGGSSEPGVTHSDKWSPSKGDRAFGAGITLGTLTDTGYAVNGKVLFVLLIPGPVILVEGRANLLTEMAKLNDAASEPTFEALAVIDGRAGTFQMNVAANYKKDKNGKIVDLRAGAEAFFDFHRADAWHFYLGQDQPTDKRIRAGIINLFQANAYFMLTARSLRFGFWVGYDKRWKFGPLVVAVSAYISADVGISWKPVHVYGRLQMHGGVELTAFGRGIIISLDALIAADVPTPVKILAELEVKLKLPKPLPSPKAHLRFEWGKEIKEPPWPLSVGAIACEHLKVIEKWPLDRLPRWDYGETGELKGFWKMGGADPDFNEEQQLARAYDEDRKDALMGLPAVPPDTAIALSFARPMFDDIGFGGRREGIGEQVGDYRFEHHLVEIALYSKKGQHDPAWTTVATRGAGSTAASAAILAGTWQLVSSGNDALPNSKLILGSNSTSDWAREQSGSIYWTWLQNQLPESYCPPEVAAAERCVHWEDVVVGTAYDYDAPCHRDRLNFTAYSGSTRLVTDVAYRPRADVGRLNALHLTLLPSPTQEPAPTPMPTTTPTPTPPSKGAYEIYLPVTVRKGSIAELVHVGADSQREPDGDDGTGARPLAIAQSVTVVTLNVNGFPYGTKHVMLYVEVPDIAGKSTVTAFNRQGTVLMTRDVGPGPNAVALDAPSGTAGWIDRVVVVTYIAREEDFFLNQVCYTAPLSPELQSSTDGWGKAQLEIVDSWKKTTSAAMLEPNTYYKLYVRTRVVRNGSAAEFGEWLYFRTLAPPGVHEANRLRTTASPAPPLEVVKPLPPHDHYPQRGPLQDLRAYVQALVPASAARAVYRAYDLSATFNEDYIETLFNKANLPLRIHLFDADGNAVMNLVQTGFTPGETVHLSRTESEWLFTYNAAVQQCQPSTTSLPSVPQLLSDMPPDPVLRTTPMLNDPLRPETLYEARLVADGAQAGLPNERFAVYSWRFITSRFTSFRHHIGSYADRLWDEHLLRGEPSVTLVDPVAVGNLAHAEANGEALNGAPPRFEAIAHLFGLGTEPTATEPGRLLRTTQARVEVTLLRDATSRYGLLLTSPEPLPADRVTVGWARATGPSDVVQPTAGPAKILAAVAGATESFVDLIVLNGADLSGWTLKSEVGTAFEAFYTVPPLTSYHEGTIVRVHTGGSPAPIDSDDPGIVHVFTDGPNSIAAGADLRLQLASADGAIVHTRRFLPPSAFIKVPQTLVLQAVTVWNSDRTAAFLFMVRQVNQGGSPAWSVITGVFSGVNRLTFVFARALAGAHGPHLSQFGDTGKETADITFDVA